MPLEQAGDESSTGSLTVDRHCATGHTTSPGCPGRSRTVRRTGWEATALDLAEGAGITTPNRRLTVVDGRQVLILDRFDRTPGGGRVSFVSAMTLLDARDGESLDYEDIALQLGDHGSAVNVSLADLFRRTALSVAVHNTDDHLRNHGLLFSNRLAKRIKRVSDDQLRALTHPRAALRRPPRLDKLATVTP